MKYHYTVFLILIVVVSVNSAYVPNANLNAQAPPQENRETLRTSVAETKETSSEQNIGDKIKNWWARWWKRHGGDESDKSADPAIIIPPKTPVSDGGNRPEPRIPDGRSEDPAIIPEAISPAPSPAAVPVSAPVPVPVADPNVIILSPKQVNSEPTLNAPALAKSDSGSVPASQNSGAASDTSESPQLTAEDSTTAPDTAEASIVAPTPQPSVSESASSATDAEESAKPETSVSNIAFFTIGSLVFVVILVMGAFAARRTVVNRRLGTEIRKHAGDSLDDLEPAKSSATEQSSLDLQRVSIQESEEEAARLPSHRMTDLFTENNVGDDGEDEWTAYLSHINKNHPQAASKDGRLEPPMNGTEVYSPLDEVSRSAFGLSPEVNRNLKKVEFGEAETIRGTWMDRESEMFDRHGSLASLFTDTNSPQWQSKLVASKQSPQLSSLDELEETESAGELSYFSYQDGARFSLSSNEGDEGLPTILEDAE